MTSDSTWSPASQPLQTTSSACLAWCSMAREYMQQPQLPDLFCAARGLPVNHCSLKQPMLEHHSGHGGLHQPLSAAAAVAADALGVASRTRPGPGRLTERSQPSTRTFAVLVVPASGAAALEAATSWLPASSCARTAEACYMHAICVCSMQHFLASKQAKHAGISIFHIT